MAATVHPDVDLVRRSVVVAGRELRPTPVFETYWRFAAERQRVYERRVAGDGGPWTDDPVLREHRFTNAFRAADRVSQYLIRNVIYDGPSDTEDVLFRVLLFKFFNKIETWELLASVVGTPSWRDFSFNEYAQVLCSARSNNIALYSPAYVVPPPRLGESTKAENHLRLIEMMMNERLAEAVANAHTLRSVYEELVSFPSIGRFIGYQLAVDLNYSEITCFSEMDFVVAGPGAVDGIRKCFGVDSVGIETEVIRFVAESQQRYFESLGLSFEGLFGRPLQLVDCQNLFCEVDKYARAVHPEVPGASGRTRIKQRFRPRSERPTAWFPPKWNLPATQATDVSSLVPEQNLSTRAVSS